MPTYNDEELQTRLHDARNHRIDLKTLELRKKAIDQELIAHLFESEGRYLTENEDGISYKLVEDGQGTWAIGTKTTRTIDPAKLVLQGVTMEQIEAATVVSVSDPFLTFYPKREKKEKG